MKKKLIKLYANMRDNSFLLRVLRNRYTANMRKELKNKDDICIICSNCIGGIIYNNLNLKFLSPTINLYMLQKDFLKFATNLEFYLKQELKFIKTKQGVCPVAHIGDGDKKIEIIFLHYNNEQEAKESWDKRKERVSYNNLYFIMSDRDGITYDDILEYDKIPCKRKILFTYKDYPNIPYTFKLNEYNKEKCVGHYQKKSWYGFREFEIKFDYVKWINGEENFRIDNFYSYLKK